MAIEISGWTRTALLALGAAAGVLVVAYIIHVAKQKGWISSETPMLITR